MDAMKQDSLSQVEVALEIAMKAHEGQRDLDGNPVILHPLTVARNGAHLGTDTGRSPSKRNARLF